jgi:hypothetical protein
MAQRGTDSAILSALVGHYSASDSEEHCRSFWREKKVEPAGLPAARDDAIHVLDGIGITLMRPPAACLGALAPAPTFESSSSAVQPAEQPPRSRRWRVCHTTACWVREAPSPRARSIDLKSVDTVVEVDAEFDDDRRAAPHDTRSARLASTCLGEPTPTHLLRLRGTGADGASLPHLAVAAADGCGWRRRTTTERPVGC